MRLIFSSLIQDFMTQEHSNPEAVDENEELRRVFPFFKTWNGLYTFVIGELVVLIILFYLFSEAFA